MLRYLEFDHRFFKRPCYRLRPKISEAEWSQFEQFACREPIFADLKAPASDLETARNALQRSFRKICTQVELVHNLAQVEPVDAVIFCDHFELTDDQQRAHAEHFQIGRLRQDPLVPTKVAIDLYVAWIANSLSGGKRVATLDTNFCSFADLEAVRYIDLLSVLHKGHGYATRLLKAVAYEAKSRRLREVVVITEVENEASLNAYKAAGFNIRSFTSAFHFKN